MDSNLIKYRNGVIATPCTKFQRIRIDLKREKQFIPYKSLIKWINAEFQIALTDIGQLTNKQADSVLRALDGKKVTR
jgi:hypothetical protein